MKFGALYTGFLSASLGVFRTGDEDELRGCAELAKGSAAGIGDSSWSRGQCDGCVDDGFELDGCEVAEAGLLAVVVGLFGPGHDRDA